MKEIYFVIFLHLRNVIKTKQPGKWSKKILLLPAMLQLEASHRFLVVHHSTCGVLTRPYTIRLLLVTELHKEIGRHYFHHDKAVKNFVHDYFQKMDATFYHLGFRSSCRNTTNIPMFEVITSKNKFENVVFNKFLLFFFLAFLLFCEHQKLTF